MREWCLGFSAFLGLQFSVFTMSAGAQPPQDVPLLLLNHDTGNFFVLASDVPFQVRKADETVSWFDVEAFAGEQTAHRTVALTPFPGGLPRGTYFSAVRIDMEGGTFLIPVALRVGEEHRNAFGREPTLERAITPDLIRTRSDDPDVELAVRATPGGHFVLEILDVPSRRQQELAIASRALSTAAVEKSETYEIVFPWMCLETPCGIPTAQDIADVAPHLDRVNAISYERYAMHGGTWSILSGVGDPGDWGKANGLALWPMAIGGYQPSQAQINAMWAGRETIAQGMIDAAQARGYEGYCVDVEGHASGNSASTFINLVTYLANRLHDNGLKLMVVHATWSTIAPFDELAASPVDYVATMDPYTSLWQTYVPNLYSRIDASRLIWGFTWDRVTGATQRTMWQWMESNGYNDGVAGAAAWRTPLGVAPNGVDYYREGFETYYPAAADVPPSPCTDADVPADRWMGEYFANTDLSGNPVAVRDDGDGFLSFDWGSGSPDSSCGIPSDRFSARWTRQVLFDAGTYRFTVSTDDGIRVSVGAQQVFDEWRDQVASFEQDVTLAAGQHDVVVEYYENGGGAVAKLSWEKIADGPPTGTPVIVDDPELLVTATGKMIWWHPETGVGYEDDMVWTQNTTSRQDNFARWVPTLPTAGSYLIEAYIPGFDKPSTQARYMIRASGETHERIVNQSLTADAWVELGSFELQASNDGSEYVELGDLTGEPNVTRNVLFDAVRFIPENGPDPCTEDVPPGAWRAEYFGNTSLSGTPALVRNEGTGFLQNHWGGGGPDTCGIGNDIFSARYTRVVSLAPGTYRFNVTSDDGVRLYLDGARILDEWRVQAPTTFETTVFIGAGDHELRVEYYENTGGAVIDVSWELVAACATPVAADHWKGEYFDGRFASGAPLLVRDDGTGPLDFNWGGGTPSDACRVPPDSFSARWTRVVRFESGTYRFTASADDGLRVRVGGTVVFDEWRDQVASFETEVFLPAGDHTVEIDYYENAGGALIALDWELLSSIVLVDDPELLVTSTGRMEWWHLESGIGHDGDMVWTQSTLSRRDNFARWTPALGGPGWYDVEAFIPPFDVAKATTSARYTVVANGTTHTGIRIDQSAHADQWARLGTFEFQAARDGTEYVELEDVTGEPNISRNVLFDAVRFAPGSPPAEPDAVCFDWPLRWNHNGQSVAGFRARISQDYDNDNSFFGGRHTALDMVYDGVNNANQPVYVAADGVIECIDDTINYPGSVAVIAHEMPDGSRVFTQYGHLNRFNGRLKAGDAVTRGQELGTMIWQSGNNHHLHFEFRTFGEVTWDYRTCAGPGYHSDPDGRGYLDPIDTIVGNGATLPRDIVNASHAARSTTLRALNVRSEPSLQGSIVGTLAAGAETKATNAVEDASGNGTWWYEIEHGGQTAYASAVQVLNFGDHAFTTASIHLSDLPQMCVSR